MSRVRAARVRRLQPIRTSSRVTAPAGLRTPRSRGGKRVRGARSWNWTAIAAVIAALAAAAGVYFTGDSLDATRDQLTIAQAQTALDQQGQHTDRFTKAVDQLDRAGPDHLQARLGGIYALERLARDSPRDHSTIVEVLTAFIRTTAPKPSPQPPTGAPANPDANCPTKGVTADIQAALTVLGRRDQSHDDPTTRIDLRNTCLRNTDLTGANLTATDLTATDLSAADLSRAHLTGAHLIGTNLTGAHLYDANLSRAALAGADLTGAHLYDAHLTGANLTGANLTRANLTRADLTRADLTGAYLSGADYDERTSFIGAVIDEATTGLENALAGW